jgi:DNA-binding transcriptional LysR family regulator
MPMKLSGIDTNLLVALDALLTERSVTRAARRLGVGQPAMSHSLARLRVHFDDPLLVPRGRELLLSPKARKLAHAAAEAIRALGNVFADTPSFDPAARRVFALACADLFSVHLVPGLLAHLRAEAPGVELDVRALTARATEQILSDDVDLAFGAFEDVPAAINQQHLFDDSYVCVVRADHPQVKKALSFETYVALPHLEVLPAPHARPGERIDRLLASKGARRRVTMRVPYFLLAAQILAQGDYVLTMTRAFAKILARTAPLRCVNVPLDIPPLRFSQIWRHERDDDEGHRWLRGVSARLCSERAR